MTTSPNTPEPAPKPSTGDIWLSVISDMEERRKLGIAKYGTPLQAFNGRRPLVDLYQELLDAVVYTRQELEERAAEPWCATCAYCGWEGQTRAQKTDVDADERAHHAVCPKFPGRQQEAPKPSTPSVVEQVRAALISVARATSCAAINPSWDAARDAIVRKLATLDLSDLETELQASVVEQTAPDRLWWVGLAEYPDEGWDVISAPDARAAEQEGLTRFDETDPDALTVKLLTVDDVEGLRGCDGGTCGTCIECLSISRGEARSELEKLKASPTGPGWHADAIRERDEALAATEKLAESIRDLSKDLTATKLALAQVTEERDQAIAHDRQPYPTAEAYEKACEALRVVRAEVEKLKAATARYEDQLIALGWARPSDVASLRAELSRVEVERDALKATVAKERR